MEEGNSLRFDDTRHYAADLKTAQRFCLNLKLKAAQPQELREYIGTNIPPVKSINIKKNYPNFYTLHTENSVSEINHMLCPRHRNEFKVFESSNIKQPFTLFDSISLAMYGDSRIGDLLKVNFISYILTLQQTPLEIFESVCCDKYPLTVISKLVQLLATYLESDIIIWSSEEFLTKTTLFAARDKKRTQDAIGIAMLFAKTGVMCAIGKSAQMSGVTITHQSVCVQPNEYIIQQIIPNFGCENEDAHNNFPNSQYISHLEFHGGTFPEIKPMSVDSNWVSDPISHCSELETWFNMFGIAYVLVNKEQWKDIKPVTVVESRLASIPFFKQTVSRLGPSMMKMVHENKKKLTRKKMKQINKEMLHFLDESKTLTSLMEESGGSYYCIEDYPLLIHEWTEGLNPNNWICKVFRKVFGTQIIKGINTPYYYLGLALSMFQIHTEDRNLYSINILLEGNIKVWFAMSRNQTRRFKLLLREYLQQCDFGHLAYCDNFIQHKIFMPDPLWLLRKGFNVFVVRQVEGGIVYTDTNSLHMGYNQSLNYSMAINFCSMNWLNHYHHQSLCTGKSKEYCQDQNIMTGNQLYEFLSFFEPEKWNLFKTGATVPIKFTKEITKLALPEAFTTNNAENTNESAIEQSNTVNHTTGHVMQYREAIQIIKTEAEVMHAKGMTKSNIIKFTENIMRCEQQFWKDRIKQIHRYRKHSPADLKSRAKTYNRLSRTEAARNEIKNILISFDCQDNLATFYLDYSSQIYQNIAPTSCYKKGIPSREVSFLTNKELRHKPKTIYQQYI